MALKESTGNMYDFVSHMWSPVRGKCKHDCSYYYMKRFPLPDMNIAIFFDGIDPASPYHSF